LQELLDDCEELQKRKGTGTVGLNLVFLDRLLNKRDVKTVDSGKLAVVAETLGLRLEDVVVSPTPALHGLEDGLLTDLRHACRATAAHAARWMLNVLARPNLVDAGTTSPLKITSTNPAHDRTTRIDRATSDAMHEVLATLARQPGHPLARGYTVVDEETGPMRHGGARRDQPTDLYFFLDPTDDTRLAGRGLGGTCLVSVYGRRLGWLAVAAADPIRRRIYVREAGAPSQVVSVSSFEGDFERGGPEGHERVFRPSGRTEVAGMSLNLYTGKPRRLLASAKVARPLLEAMGEGELLSEGGSRGLILVCEGLVDAAVEIVSGFRALDLMPGAFLAEGAGLTCTDLKGTPLQFGPDRDLEDALDRMVAQPERASKELDKLRRKFIVAASPALAREIAALIP
jgi:fructose-1,6-bisphosphatase/inositol monophosphatase family enzyme